VDVRIVVATHRDLFRKVQEGSFREDLYYRLNVVEIHVPALRERTGDIPLLAQHFLQKYAAANGKEVRAYDDEVLTMLLRHPWPGNVRELENAIERAVVMSEEPVLRAVHFPTLRRAAATVEGAPDGNGTISIPGSTLEEIEREAILRTLEAVGGSTSRASEILQISPRKIQYKVKEYHQRGAVADKVSG
jgi:two-component system NtrC family response regulator/two-component system response regulator HydG